jgi:endonuclease III related protein
VNSPIGSIPWCGPSLRRAYRLLLSHFGHQQWWPGETPFEVCVGAILTQNTNWSNVERAVANLRAACCLDPYRLFALPEEDLALLIRPSGYYKLKARRLGSFVRVLVQDYQGSLGRLFEGTRAAVRKRLLAIPGVGPETADSMLLYAGGHASFVVDAYTRRIFSRHGWCLPDASYDHLQDLCERMLLDRPAARLLDYWQDYHAQLVMVGKHFCRTRQPRCDRCPLRPLLPLATCRKKMAGPCSAT